MMRSTRLGPASVALAAVIAIAGAREAAAERVQVEVVEIAGGLAYLEPGAKAGLRPGQTVVLGKASFEIVEVTEGTAVVRIGATRVAVGDRGAVNGVEPGAATTRRLPPPRPASTWTGQWPEAVRPSSQQSPADVPLGQGRAPGRLHAAVIGSGMFSPNSKGASSLGDGEANGRLVLSYDLLADGRLAADLDVIARLYSTGYDSRQRTPVWLRTAQLRYGPARDPRVALGRIPWAATGVGILDGVRAAARFGTFQVAAFGGLVPDARNGRDDTGTSRFGAEVGYDDPSSSWQPRVSLTAYGSTFDRSLDERRAGVYAGATHGGLDLDGWAEVQSFPSGNPWGAHALELTGAGLGAEYRRRGKHVGVDVTMLRPERSMRLAAALPPGWLCARVPLSATPEDCAGNDLWSWATGSAGLSTSHVLLDVGGSVGTTHSGGRFVDASVFGRAELRGLPRRGRVIGGGFFGRSSFLDSAGGELGAGFGPIEDVDVTITYRPEVLAYVARTETWLVHSVILDGRWALRNELDLDGSAIVTTGPDRDALVMIASVVWRPLP